MAQSMETVFVVVVDDSGARLYPDRCKVVDRYSVGRLAYLVVEPEVGAPKFHVATTYAFPTREEAQAYVDSVQEAVDEARSGGFDADDDEDVEPEIEEDEDEPEGP